MHQQERYEVRKLRVRQKGISIQLSFILDVLTSIEKFPILLYQLFATKFMKKGIIVGIVIAIIIVVSAVAVSQDDSADTSEISLNEDVQIEPKRFTVDLEESIGFSEGP